MTYNRLLTGEGSEKETRHVELTLDEGMTYTPGDAVGIIPENRAIAVAEVLEALHYTAASASSTTTKSKSAWKRHSALASASASSPAAP